MIRLHQPLTLHGTDGSGEEDEGGEPLQAAVLSRPYALSGALPEELIKAVASPCSIDGNNPAYEVKEANLLVLCKITLEARDGADDALEAVFDLSALEVPDEIDLTVRQVLRMSIQALRRTLENYYSHDEDSLQWKVVIEGTREGNASLKDLGKVFTIGKEPDDLGADAAPAE